MNKITISVIGFILAISGLFSPVLASADSTNQSYNWSGYVTPANSGSYTSVSGGWTVPTVSNTNQLSTDVTWVGIGGITSSDIIQAGTQAIVNSSGPVTYEAWYELLPASTQTVPLTVHAGDSISVSIAEQGTATNTWLVSFRNNTTGQSYQLTVNYASTLSSAEWIEELPATELTNSISLPLDNFGLVLFNGVSATRNGSSLTASALGAQAYTLVNTNDQVLATPSALGSDGESFSVTRSSASAGSQTVTTPTYTNNNPTTIIYTSPAGNGSGITAKITYYNNSAPTTTVYQIPATTYQQTSQYQYVQPTVTQQQSPITYQQQNSQQTVETQTPTTVTTTRYERQSFRRFTSRFYR